MRDDALLRWQERSRASFAPTDALIFALLKNSRSVMLAAAVLTVVLAVRNCAATRNVSLPMQLLRLLGELKPMLAKVRSRRTKRSKKRARARARVTGARIARAART